MKTTIYFMLMLYLLIFLAACSKDKHSGRIRFNGITARDINADPIAPPDPTDWRTDDQWTAQEEALFSAKSTKRTAKITSIISKDSALQAYPNPSLGSFAIEISGLDEGSLVAYRIVDRNYTVLQREDSASPTKFLINKADLGITEDTVRVYYKIDTHGSVYRGHGDISLVR